MNDSNSKGGIHKKLNTLFAEAINEVTKVGLDCDPHIRPAVRPEFGDYQANFAIGLAKRFNQKASDLALSVIDHIKPSLMFDSLTVAGPGFINIQLANFFLNEALSEFIKDDFHSFKTARPETIVIDYGGMNVAKEMHVGHLRSSIIGDALSRIFEFVGHKVIRQNHLGDWGTQFGMLVESILEQGIQFYQTTVPDLNVLYQQAKVKFDTDPLFAERAKKQVVYLQQGQKESLAVWQDLVSKSEIYFQSVLQRLDLKLNASHHRGESAYKDHLPVLVENLLKAGLAVREQNAVVIFLPGFVDAEKNPLPLMIQKSDGAYLYATTDLAAAEYRLKTFQPDRLIYVTDARQKLHFSMLFEAIKKIGWGTPQTRFYHITFGAVLNEDKKPFKTRSGEAIKLIDLIDEAERKAGSIIENKNTIVSDTEKERLAHIIGIGALKYADLSSDLARDYVFSWERLLSFEGNTAPYLQNAYVRIHSVFRKGGINRKILVEQSPEITDLQEHRLTVKLLQFEACIEALLQDLRPNRLCTYLYELAAQFHQFYENCPILTSTNEKQKWTRLLLCDAVEKVLKQGLDLLGIQVIEKM